MTHYICTKFHKISQKGLKVFEQIQFPKLKFSKGKNSLYIYIYVDRVMVLVLCTLPDGTLYLYHVI